VRAVVESARIHNVLTKSLVGQPSQRGARRLRVGELDPSTIARLRRISKDLVGA
jgi:hypothetical protein